MAKDSNLETIASVKKKDNIEIINATCPYVSKTQNYAKSLSEDGYELIILGDRDHPEVKALRSYVDKEVIIVANADELADKQFKKVGIISQTTRRVEDLQELVKKLVPKCHELRVINTMAAAINAERADPNFENDLVVP